MLGAFPVIQDFMPTPIMNSEPILLDLAEFEVLRLIELEDLSQEEAGKRMGISRGTVWRLLKSGRKKIVKALVEGRPISIVSGILENSEEKF